MAFYLVVAHQTAVSPELITSLQRIAVVDPDAEFVLLVPATPTRHLLTWVEGDATAVAQARVEEAAATLRAASLTVRDAVVGDADPMKAIRQEVGRHERPYMQAVISTLPLGVSRWLGRDLPNQVRRDLGLPVLHVIGSAPAQEKRGNSAPAESLAGWPAGAPPLTLAELSAWLGRPLHCLDGEAGDLREVLYDYVTGQPAWLGATSRPLPFHTLLVPATPVRVIDNSLVAPFSRERVLAQPHVDIGEGFASLTDEEHIYDYYGLPFSDVLDLRVLRAGQHLPGGERNWQNILTRNG